jgi:L-lactate dehydrogenase complex protein LldG
MTMDRNRAILLDHVRKALAARSDDGVRGAAVAERLRQHPRGTIPARAHGDRDTLLQVFTDMLKGQGAELVRATTLDQAVTAIAADLREHNLPAILRLGADPVLASLPWSAAPSLELRFGKAEPEDQAGLSRAVVAAAETGTLFLTSGSDNPTTLAFLPEHHTILIRVEDIVGAYEDAFDVLRHGFGEGALPRTLNLVSGPSRTADIEQTIVRGAHGPKRLLVVVLG